MILILPGGDMALLIWGGGCFLYICPLACLFPPQAIRHPLSPFLGMLESYPFLLLLFIFFLPLLLGMNSFPPTFYGVSACLWGQESGFILFSEFHGCSQCLGWVRRMRQADWCSLFASRADHPSHLTLAMPLSESQLGQLP